MYRNLGMSNAILVGLLDILKGSLTMGIARFSLNNHYEIAVIAFAVIVGHIFPIFLKGKGGKGIATTFGVALILMGWKVVLVVIAVWAMLLVFTRFMSLSNLILIWIFPMYFVFIKPDLAYFMLGVALTVLVYWVHRENIERLKLNKELRLEVTIGFKRPPAKTVMVPSAPALLNRSRKVSTKKKLNQRSLRSISTV